MTYEQAMKRTMLNNEAMTAILSERIRRMADVEIVGIGSQGHPVPLYVGPSNVPSLRSRLQEFSEAFSVIEFDESTDMPGRELAVAKQLQLLTNAYVIALERASD